ncbi:hypothetical protein L1987_01110 [Smallanthus sonchifolius]|uniref:Uncharacterized protein n=1 Tax=Smallanthus sonchifolius TaxID=185202 RepID=A0ACB9K482_9ASTR|nr:hypothetical protein L1987_01110 [Smallanthus sonchifolius]
MPYAQKTLEEATFEHNKNHPWNFKDLFNRKDYVYFQRDKIAKSCFVYGKYNHTARSPCLHQEMLLLQKPQELNNLASSVVNQTTLLQITKNKSKPSAATKSAADQSKPSAATKFAAVQSKPSNIENYICC